MKRTNFFYFLTVGILVGVFTTMPLFAPPIGSGGVATLPGGSTTQVQFNLAGAFAGDSDFVWDSTLNKLTINTNLTFGALGAWRVPSDGVFELYNNAGSRALLRASRYEIAEQSAPGTPGSGLGVAYAKTDGKLYWKDDAGVEYDLTSSGAPGGSTTQVQFNNAGAFGGDAGMTYNSGTDVLSLTGGVSSPSGTLLGFSFSGTQYSVGGNANIKTPSAGVVSIINATDYQSAKLRVYYDNGANITHDYTSIEPAGGITDIKTVNSSGTKASLAFSPDNTRRLRIDHTTGSVWAKNSLSVGFTDEATDPGDNNLAVEGAVYVGGTASINKIGKVLQGSAAIDFASVATTAESTTQTITVTGAAEGDPVFLGLVNAAGSANVSWTCWVSASNTVSIKFYNRSGSSVDLASLTYKVTVHQQ